MAWTRTNAAANAVGVSASTTPITAVPGTFDLVLANVLPVVHDAIASAVAARRAEQGVLVVSGIPDERADGVVGCYVAFGLIEGTPRQHRRLDGCSADGSRRRLVPGADAARGAQLCDPFSRDAQLG
ncbi:MAG: hypothetical protein CM1200mP26_01180 [Acidimicrobiales bacterium]|nr:MAG: hypothetical protein CM1200mP26_01180 [Acidimicrobiales bacterium]